MELREVQKTNTRRLDNHELCDTGVQRMNEGPPFELLGYFVTVWSPSPQAQRTEYPRRGSKSLKAKVDTDQCDCPVTNPDNSRQQLR